MPKFEREIDRQNERRAADLLEKKWACLIHKFPEEFAPIDWWAEKDGSRVALLEIKTRNFDSSMYDTVFFSVRKYNDLIKGTKETGLPSFFVAQLFDGIWWIRVEDVKTKEWNVIWSGHNNPRAKNDKEWLIEVPIKKMNKIRA